MPRVARRLPFQGGTAAWPSGGALVPVRRAAGGRTEHLEGAPRPTKCVVSTHSRRECLLSAYTVAPSGRKGHARGSLEEKGRGRAMGWLCWISPRLSHLLGPHHSRWMRARRRAHMLRVSASSKMAMGSSGKGSEAGV